MESRLAELEAHYVIKGATSAEAFARRAAIRGIDRDMVTVFILSGNGVSGEVPDKDALRRHGGEIVKSSAGVTKARVPIGRITGIAGDVPGVQYIQLPDVPHAAAVVSEGVSLTGATSYHNTGTAGAGVKVAIIDLGFANLAAAKASGDLPDNAVLVDCTGAACATTTFPSETEAHGTGVAEIVRDMAPAAQLYLIKVADRLDLEDAKDYCIANGIRVVNHSVGWVNTNFYDGQCFFGNPVCTTDSAFANGILWVNSAGNSATDHFEATFADAGGDGFHDQAVTLTADAGDSVEVFLTWNAWPTTTQDYDFFLHDASGTVVASSINRPPPDGIPPVESIIFTVAAAGDYTLKVQKVGATANLAFEIYSFNHSLTPAVPSSSLDCPADAASVMAVAAVRRTVWTTGPQETFSSRGPTNDGRTKPEISGPDGVTNATFSTGFFGTSASSPHVAGAAALILSKHPAFSVVQLRNTLTASAVDMGTPGNDNIFGFGRLSLQSDPGTPDLLSPANGATGMATTVTVTWKKATDPDGDTVTYKLFVGTDNAFTGVTPTPVAAAVAKNDAAVRGGARFPFVLIGMIPVVGLSRRARRTVLVWLIAVALGLMAFSCGSGGTGSGGLFGAAVVPDATTVSSNVPNLQAGTTYFWKVVAEDGRGGTAESEIFRFTTAN